MKQIEVDPNNVLYEKYVWVDVPTS